MSMVTANDVKSFKNKEEMVKWFKDFLGVSLSEYSTELFWVDMDMRMAMVRTEARRQLKALNEAFGGEDEQD